MSLSRRIAVCLALGLAVHQAQSQGVPLPPIVESPAPTRLPPRPSSLQPVASYRAEDDPLPPPVVPTTTPIRSATGQPVVSYQKQDDLLPLPKEKRDELPPPRVLPKNDELPPPKPLREDPLSPLIPPKLGQLGTPGDKVGQPVGCPPLLLQDVLASVDRHYPLIYAAEQERNIAAGARLATLGAFDHNLRSQNYIDGGTFASQRYNMIMEQLTPFQGISYYAGYRAGLGSFPIYYQDRKTGDGGEFLAGIVFPLAKNREIDSARAALAKATIDQQLVEPTIQLQRIDIARAASLAYWIWVAAGQRLMIARDILRLAQERDQQLARRIAAGNLAQIEREDNKRIIIDRQARVVVAQRAFQQASILLSIYVRDENGIQQIPKFEQLPAFIEPPQPPDGEQRLKDLEAAMANRPEIQRLALQREKIRVDLDLNENQLMPGVNVGLAGAQDFGQTKKDLYKTFGQVSVLVDVPIERRQARGRILALQAEMARLLAQERFARDRVQMEVQNALNGLDRAYDLLQQGRDNKAQNEYLADAERRMFDVGKSDLFRVNIRELNAAEARVLEIDAAVEFYRSLVEYHAAVGLDPTRNAGKR